LHLCYLVPFIVVRQNICYLMKMQPTSLQQRTFFFILLPTFFLLVGISIFGYILVRDILLAQWGEIAVANLQRTAHQVDTRLRRPKELLLILQNNAELSVNHLLFDNIISQIKELDGVIGVNIVWPGQDVVIDQTLSGKPLKMVGRMPRYRFERFEISSPVYNKKLDNRTVSLVSEFTEGDAATAGKIEIIISFYNLIDQIFNAPWWKSNKAYLIGGSGNVLANTSLEFDLEDYFPMRAFGTVSTLEKDTLAALQRNDAGTVFGPGSPPGEISGYYHLAEAPWTMVVIAPGKLVLRPILRFKFFYILSIGVCILFILLFIRGVMSRITTRIEAVSAAADNLASGNFGAPLVVTSRDEVGELAKSFNTMIQQLQQRLQMKKAIDVAREIQQSLLPQYSFVGRGIIVSGKSIYCDETGGDFFDILKYPGSDQKVGLVVGDVVGHGIGAALLMTTVRALLRCRITQPGDLGKIMSDVNTLLCQDTTVSGNFVTIFYLVVDLTQSTISWVRAGHEPAIVYFPATGVFSELKGNGMALGVDDRWTFECNKIPVLKEEQLILLGSDGAWEVENIDGEQFGKERIRQILAATFDTHPDNILKKIVREIAVFRGDAPQSDDITLAVVKVKLP